MDLRNHLMIARPAALILAAALSIIACASDQTIKKEVINVVLKEWQITADVDHVKAGVVTFRATNNGKEEHELVIVKTDLPIDELPMRNGKVAENHVGDLIGEIEEFSPSTIEEVSYNLAPGRYVLFCNIVEADNGKARSHYMEGMRIAIIVE